MEPLNSESASVGIYDAAVARIINRFDCHYHSISSLQNLIILIDSLSKAESNPREREYYVNALKTIVNSYGTEDKRLDDFKANEVITVLKSSLNIVAFKYEHTGISSFNSITDCTTTASTTSSTTTSTDNVDAFDVLVVEFIRDFEKYTTALSLRGMTDRLSELPIELKQKHSDHYNSITGVIMSYGKESKPLTSHQSKKLMRTLRCEDDNKIVKSPYRPNVHFLEASYSKPAELIGLINQHNLKINQNNIIKLSQDDVLCEIVRSLQQELMGNFGSGMTKPVANFFESCELILGDEQKYDVIMKDIENHFKSCGWKMKDDVSLGGFQTAPDTTKIINGLVRIIDAYF